MKILAAVVTHNRRELLSRCITKLRSQTRAPDEILVVNNGSTDGTVDMLVCSGVSFVTQENVGSAGGWHRCIEYGLEHGFDAIWLMDDDGFPDEGSLASLVDAFRPGVACASSVVVREDDPSHFVFPFPVLDSEGMPVLIGYSRKIPNLSQLRAVDTTNEYPFAHFFNGALISIDAIQRAGNVDRDFFLYGEEVDYFFRLRRVGAVISVLSALHYHPDVSKRPYTLAKVYYLTRNTVVLNARYFSFVFLRHLVTIAAVLVRTANRNGIRSALSLVIGSAAPAFYSAIFKGLRGKLGKDFNG
jgi:rhamnopyranosyl-N-acetylglucosaminyl-diphospho-decaprenol beta-1,3/1,4-galactofuranosyltransferase